jgi:hypothetical protein
MFCRFFPLPVWRCVALVLLLAAGMMRAQVPGVGPGRCYPSCSGPGCGCGGCPGCRGAAPVERAWSGGTAGGVATPAVSAHEAALAEARKAQAALGEGRPQDAVTYYEWAIIKLPWGMWDLQRSTALKQEWKEEMRRIKASLAAGEQQARQSADARRALAKQQDEARRKAAKYAVSDQAFQEAASAWRLHDFRGALQKYDAAERALPARLFDWSADRKMRVKRIEENRKLLTQVMAEAARKRADVIGEDELDDLPPVKATPGGSAFAKGFLREVDDLMEDEDFMAYHEATRNRSAEDGELPRLANQFARVLAQRPAVRTQELTERRQQHVRSVQKVARSLEARQGELVKVEASLLEAKTSRDEVARAHATAAAAAERQPANPTLQRQLEAGKKQFDAAQRRLDGLEQTKSAIHTQTARLRDEMDAAVRKAAAGK